MKTVGVICEFNPFHNGHAYLLRQIRQTVGSCRIAAIMSGSFTQRGDAAVADKFARAGAALKNGADLVAELPVVYAVSSGEIFAKAGVEIARLLGCDAIAFGAESDGNTLKKIAEIQKTPEFSKALKTNISEGINYPAAVEKATNSTLGEEFARAIKMPNNILGIEYIKAMLPLNIMPIAIKRAGVMHDDKNVCENFASASKIREMLYHKDKKAFSYMPESTYLEEYSGLSFTKNLEMPILYKLRSMKPEDFAVLPDVNEGLENRFYSAARNNNSVEEILASVKTKRYTHARLRRIIICSLLGITKELQKIPVPYLRILGFNTSGAEILNYVSKNSTAPIITSVSRGTAVLKKNAAAILEKDILANDILCLAKNSPDICGRDYTTAVIKI